MTFHPCSPGASTLFEVYRWLFCFWTFKISNDCIVWCLCPFSVNTSAQKPQTRLLILRVWRNNPFWLVFEMRKGGGKAIVVSWVKGGGMTSDTINPWLQFLPRYRNITPYLYLCVFVTGNSQHYLYPCHTLAIVWAEETSRFKKWMAIITQLLNIRRLSRMHGDLYICWHRRF